ncbi:5' 3' exoribonuclease 1 [Echinococcus multilocularis]|uniref:5' 3' exoribonuclease 1 n=1 Tax=Echinococcus multilocularis TaxID=6211 RepID=A0A087W1E2_ECHMU|nr:5' 3' exoribonuclease 1 [Echinococcus multilocularis]
MGVPKFYRWISQRYPCINQILRPNEVVMIDHLYLDLNGIIHSSSHCDDAHSNIYNEDLVFQTIANYLNHIICLIRPQKTVFLAVDGVAPRAKMTQQRARRFVGAEKLATELKKRREKEPEFDEKSLFDPNVISPGTEFMESLHEFFKRFIADQISSDPLWRRIDVIYSGHDVPGEGEQKIREYMLYQRTLSGYQPNERHCLYGMDADLMFLGLATHEPNICILRENVYTVKSPLPQDIPFCLVHLSLLREYIGLEFKSLESEIAFPFDLERIIDDWIFMGYLLGNDFIPHLPNMHIHAESTLYLWDTYHVVLPQLDGYINEFGTLNLERFHIFLSELSKFDTSWFEEREADQRWMQGKHGARMARELERLGKVGASVETEVALATGSKTVAERNSSVDDGLLADFFSSTCNIVPFLDSNESDRADENSADHFKNIPSINKSNDFKAVNAEELNGKEMENDGMYQKIEGLASIDEQEDKDDEGDVEHEVWFDRHNHATPNANIQFFGEDEDEDALAYRMHRQDYYARKLKIDIRGDSERTSKAFVEAALLPICRQYVKTLQWVLSYYFKSVADWSYYYPYHYAPFASDLLIFTKRFAKDGVEHNKLTDWADFTPNTKPMLPFEQQMFIMPAMSANIVPQPYRWLLASSGSPVSEFFPKDFETDINGKLADWEAVVLIPFIDETKMLAAMAPCTKTLSPEDSKRNVHRGHFVLRAKDREKVDYPATFRSLVSEEIDCGFFHVQILRAPHQYLQVCYQMPRHVDLGFPSLYRIPFTYKITRVGVRTFSFPSKGESVSLIVEHPLGRSTSDPGSLKIVANSYLGQAILTGWPYSRLVVPFAVMDENEIWEVDMKASTSSQSSEETMRVVERTSRRKYAEAPFWMSVRWLRLQAEWSVSRLRDSCAITLASEQPRAALLCLSATDCLFSVVVDNSDPSHISLRPLCTHATPLMNKTMEPRAIRRRRMPPRVNKQSLCSDANVSITLGGEASLEILDLTMDPSTTPFIRSLTDVFPLASRALIFTPNIDRCFGRIGEIVGSAIDGKLTIQLFPDPPLAEDPSSFLTSALKADESSYLTPMQMSRDLHLAQHIIQRIVGDFMVHVPPPPSGRAKKRKPRDGALECTNLANIGFSLVLHRKHACVVGWSRYSWSKETWVYSRRTVDTIARYNQLFPDVVKFIGASDMHVSAFEMSDIFPTNTFERYSQLRMFLRNEVKGNRIVTDANAPLLDTKGLLVVQSHLFPDSPFPTSLPTDCTRIEIAPTDVFAILPDGGRIVPQCYQTWLKRLGKKFDTFELVDRVMYVGPRHDIFGLCGFVIGVYLALGQETIEVMFDRPFDGAISIRGSSSCCLAMASSHLLHYPRFAESTSARKQKERSSGSKKQRHLGKEFMKKEAFTVLTPQSPPLSTANPIDSVLPSDWLANPPSEFASSSTAVAALNKKATKCVSTSSKKPLPQSPSPSIKHSNSSVAPSPLGQRPVQSHSKSHQQLQNQQKKHQIRLGPKTVDQATASLCSLQANSAPMTYPTSEVQLPLNPQAPALFPPSPWCSNSIKLLPEICSSGPEQSPGGSPPWVQVDPRFVAFFNYEWSLFFVDSLTGQVFSVEQLRDLYFSVEQQAFQSAQFLECFTSQQPQLQPFVSPVNDSHLSVPTHLPESENTNNLTNFVPTQAASPNILCYPRPAMPF